MSTFANAHNKSCFAALFMILSILYSAASVNAAAVHPYRCDGTATDVFDENETFCVYGTGFGSGNSVDVYVVRDKDVYVEGEDITSQSEAAKHGISITQRGILALTRVWESVKKGLYDIIVDINRNGKYDSGDVVNIGNGAGVRVGELDNAPEVPEFSTITAGLVLLGANYIIWKKRGRK